MRVLKNGIVGGALLGSVALAYAVPVLLNFEAVSENNQNVNNLYSGNGATFGVNPPGGGAFATGVLNIPPFVGFTPGQFYFQDTPTGGGSIHGHSALQLPQFQQAPNTSTPALLSFENAIVGTFEFSYASRNGLSVTINSVSNGSRVVNFESTDGGNSPVCQFQSTIDKPVCNWQSSQFDFNSLFSGTGVSVASIGFAYLGVSYDGYGYVDNMKYDNGVALAVPEPSTYALMTLGLLGIGLVARRRMS